MNRARLSAFLLAVLALLVTAPAPWAGAPADRAGDAASVVMSAAAEKGEEVARPVWVFLADKGRHESDPEALAAAAARLSTRALARRARALPAGAVVGWRDLPLEPDYLDALAAAGFAPRAESRWLNAVSVLAAPAGEARLAALAFVARVEPVRASERYEPATAPARAASRWPAPGSPYDPSGRYRGVLAGGREDPIDYGASLAELTQINVPAVHQTGNHGEGVVVGMLDTGWNLEHDAFADLIVLGAWDFIQGDSVVANEPGEVDYQDAHGTMTLSTIAGHLPGELVGPAFGAAYYLAKTEDRSQEVPVEEDWWVAGIEWLESVGCDLVSSSLGYYDWYEFEDLDGNTAVTTIAADIAVGLGVMVVNSAGNSRVGFGHIIAPADGDSVLAVGAVDADGVVTSFSSPGPTYDGRIKPDVMARGLLNHVVDPGDPSGYLAASGTSFACPLTAGVAALLLAARPDATPMQVRDALRETADRAANPDNDYGWGLIDALAAVDYLVLTGAPASAPAPAAAIVGAWPNPFNPAARIAFRLGADGPARLAVHDTRGRRVIVLADGVLSAGEHAAVWDGRDAAGRPVASGVYLARLEAAGASATRRLVLLK
ncbi:MAG: S8 family serine peptidase [Candidatus Krumholzibacteriota bacterium]|nr:S8 family serine peptidase [Candidatus Krumholzibacteriota bacterium]